MSSRSDRFVFELAKEEDKEDILKVYESMDFKGGISVLYTRRPDPIASLRQEGDKILIPVMRDVTNGNIVGIGCWVIRKAYLNGSVKRVAYLMSLKILPEYQRKTPHLSKVYSFLYELTKGEVDLYYTTILKENILVQKMLEKKRKHMPEYRPRGEYTVFTIKTGNRLKKTAMKLDKGFNSDFEEFYDYHIKNLQLALPNLREYAIPSESFFSLKDESGEIVACCAIWNQQSVKQHIVTAYNGVYKWIHRLPTGLLGYPNFPPTGQPINYASITGLCVKNNDEKVAKIFLDLLSSFSKDYLFLMVGLHESHPLCPVLLHMKTVTYKSILYTVQFEEADHSMDEGPVGLEVALL